MHQDRHADRERELLTHYQEERQDSKEAGEVD
jgi:hypothetical protein